MKIALLSLTLLLAVARVAARDVVVLGATEPGERAPRYTVASGGTLMIDVLVPAAVKRDGLTYELWQAAGAVGLPLGKPVALAGEADARGVTPVPVVFPEVKRTIEVWVKFFETAAAAPAVEAGRARVWVYPAVDWAPVAKRFKDDAGTRLVVFGESAGLREFLNRRAVTFTDLGEAIPDKVEAGVIAAGALTAQDWRERKHRQVPAGGRLVVFIADAEGLPGVYTTVNGTGAVTLVTLPVLERLAADPQAETTFLKIIEQQRHAAPAALF